jgi:Short C-terminal domain
MDVVIDGTPESCLAQVEAFFAHSWSHGGNYRRLVPNTITLRARAPQHRYMLDSRRGVVMFIILTLITGGAFGVVWFIYWIIREAGASGPAIYTATVVATPESPNQTRLSVSASREDWRKTLESWVQKELVENRAAAKETSNEQPGASDIPGQIGHLAELRDGGVITAEEFEEKKRDLLGRM